jgi:hypothetical protein
MRERFRQNFDRHVAPELRVVRLIHLSHSARADLSEYFVGAELRASSECHFFNPAIQLRTTVMGAGVPCSVAVLIRNRWPSVETTYALSDPIERV